MLASFGAAGVSVALARTGAEFATTTLAVSGGPAVIPSRGVAVQATVSPPLKLVESVFPVPATTSLIVHVKVVASTSPSRSV